MIILNIVILLPMIIVHATMQCCPPLVCGEVYMLLWCAIFSNQVLVIQFNHLGICHCVLYLIARAYVTCSGTCLAVCQCVSLPSSRNVWGTRLLPRCLRSLLSLSPGMAGSRASLSLRWRWYGLPSPGTIPMVRGEGTCADSMLVAWA